MKQASGAAPVPDRRIQKTKKQLSEALIALILEKGYEKITIQDIIDRANTGRSTFYSHYESKEQLLLDGHKNLGIAFFDESRTLDFLEFFKHAGENHDLGMAMFGKKSGGILLSHFQDHIAYRIREEHKADFGRTKYDQLMLGYYAGAAAAVVISLLVSWLEGGMPVIAEEMANKCHQIVDAVFSGK